MSGSGFRFKPCLPRGLHSVWVISRCNVSFSLQFPAFAINLAHFFVLLGISLSIAFASNRRIASARPGRSGCLRRQCAADRRAPDCASLRGRVAAQRWLALTGGPSGRSVLGYTVREMPHARLHKSYEINSGLKHGIFGDDIALQINVILAVYFGDDGPAEHEVELFIHLEKRSAGKCLIFEVESVQN
jgi:hypothetical protein